jgi:hypothetical protein
MVHRPQHLHFFSKHTTSLYHSDSYHTSNDFDVSQDAICLIGLLENVNNVCIRLRNLLLRLRPKQTLCYKYCTLEVTPRFLLMITCQCSNCVEQVPCWEADSLLLNKFSLLL